MSIPHLTKAQLLHVIKVLRLQIKEEQRLREDCIQEMLSMYESLPADEAQKRIKNILESPGESIE